MSALFFQVTRIKGNVVILQLHFVPQTLVLSCILVFKYLGEESVIIIENILPKLNIMS